MLRHGSLLGLVADICGGCRALAFFRLFVAVDQVDGGLEGMLGVERPGAVRVCQSCGYWDDVAIERYGTLLDSAAGLSVRDALAGTNRALAQRLTYLERWTSPPAGYRRDGSDDLPLRQELAGIIWNIEADLRDSAWLGGKLEAWPQLSEVEREMLIVHTRAWATGLRVPSAQLRCGFCTRLPDDLWLVVDSGVDVAGSRAAVCHHCVAELLRTLDSHCPRDHGGRIAPTRPCKPCHFCGAQYARMRFAAPSGTGICDRCVDRLDRTFAEERARIRCDFCGDRSNGTGDQLAVAMGHAVCGDCLGELREVIDDKLPRGADGQRRGEPIHSRDACSFCTRTTAHDFISAEGVMICDICIDRLQPA